MKKERMLLLPKSFVETYLNDLDDDDRLEMMSIIFNWYMEVEIPLFKSKVVKVIFNNLLPILEGHKQNYLNGQKGGAPKNNTNAKKTTPLVLENNHQTTPIKKINNPKEKEKEKEKDIDKDKDKDKENKNLIRSSTGGIFDFDMFSDESQKLADIELKKLLNK